VEGTAQVCEIDLARIIGYNYRPNSAEDALSYPHGEFDMYQTEWPVLLVDDDADVLAVSRLAMKSFEIDGIPIKLLTATSKEEAVELFSSSLGGTALPYISVAFIDVVMETHRAGLDLCRYIRETLSNRLTQIYIRTGQAGVAPEREVIDGYDINGYFSKAEMNEDKLYSLVKAGIRQFDFASMAVLELDLVTRCIANAGSMESLRHTLDGTLGQIPLDPHGAPTRAHAYECRVVLLDGNRLLGGNYSEAEAVTERDRLVRLGLQPLTPSGDAYVQDGHNHLVKAAATEAHGEAWHLGCFPGIPSPGDSLLLLNVTKAIATLAKRAGAAQ
jgi:CheY-like chemotaxis protein